MAIGTGALYERATVDTGAYLGIFGLESGPEHNIRQARSNNLRQGVCLSGRNNRPQIIATSKVQKQCLALSAISG